MIIVQPIPCVSFEILASFIILSQDIQRTTWNSYEFPPQPNPIESLNTPVYNTCGGVGYTLVVGHEGDGRTANGKKNSNAKLYYILNLENHASLGFNPLNPPV